MKVRDRAGQCIGRLFVVARAGSISDKAAWLVQCECGTIKTVIGSNLGHTRSCGCLQRELAKAQFTTHSHGSTRARSREYGSWRAMKDRCLCPSNVNFANYGALGITICERWVNSFGSFLADMGPRPPRTSLDRINGKGNYEPGNCRWATPKQQTDNRANMLKVEADGVVYTAHDYAKLHGIKPATLRLRLNSGWPLWQATLPPSPIGGNTRPT